MPKKTTAVAAPMAPIERRWGRPRPWPSWQPTHGRFHAPHSQLQAIHCAVKTAWMPDARSGRRCHAPKPRSGAPKAPGLTAVIPAAAQSAMPSIAPPYSVSHRRRFSTRPLHPSRLSSVSNLHQLDGVRSEKLPMTCE